MVNQPALALVAIAMTRGNRREIDRMRAQNRHAKPGTGEKKTGDPNQRFEKDAAALQEKIARKKALQEAGGSVAPAPVAKKK